MSTLRVSNIEAKADPSSPTVNEKVKITNSNGDVMLQLDGATTGITTVGINTTDPAFTVDSAQNVNFVGVVTASSLSGNLTGNVTGNVTGNLTGDVTGNVTGQISGIQTSITVGRTFLEQTYVGVGTTTQRVGVNTALGTLIYNTTTGNLEAFGLGGWVNVKTLNSYAGMTATGGVISDYTDPGPGNIFRSHTFYSSGTFTVSSLSTDYPNTVDYILVGGGGGGGNDNGGGGGAGALIYKGGAPVTTTGYPIVIGSGGAHGAPPGESNQNGRPGNDTTAFSLTAGGGGGGSGDANTAPGQGLGGGSGGGGGMGNQPRTGGGISGSTTPAAVVSNPISSDSPDNGWTNPGGTGSAYNSGTGGGGGGAGAAGGGAGTDGSWPGGNGLAFTLSEGPGNPVTYAGGGGGGGSPGPAGSGGSGGGGGGNAPTGPQPPFNGTYGRGGGGGGGQPSGGLGGRGGSGVAVIRYQIGSSQTDTAKATGGLISFSGGQTIHQFLSSGDFNVTDSSLTSVSYLVVAGGGAGGNGNHAGGGGAGGVRNGSGLPVSPGPYTVTVGSGGAANSTYPAESVNGSPSIFSTITSQGGGGGGQGANAYEGKPGGSGGGGNGNPGTPNTEGTGNRVTGTSTPAPSQGNPGGFGTPVATGAGSGGGGGGAGGAGSPAPGVRDGGNGGNGAEYSISGSPVFYGGGGGGQSWDGSPVPAGGTGGGGNGAGDNAASPDAGSGEVNTGGGGGGGRSAINPNSKAGSGGSGIVIIAYPT